MDAILPEASDAAGSLAFGERALAILSDALYLLPCVSLRGRELAQIQEILDLVALLFARFEE